MTQPGQPYEHYEVPPAGQEYTGQYDPQPPYPYAGPPHQPYSAQPYNQPYSAPPQPFREPGYPQPQPPAPPRFNSGLIALLASLGVLAVVAVAVVMVTVVRSGDDQPSAGPAPTASGAATTAPAQVGPVDPCLVGNWKQTTYSSPFDLSKITLDGKKMGEVKLSGSGRTWKITVDGKGTEDWSKAQYTGRTADGHNVVATFTGTNEWTLKTANNQILFTSTGSDVVITITVDGKQQLNESVKPFNNPLPYECSSNSWTAKSLTDPDANTIYQRTD
ncbi:hypothetical protein GCM10009557_41790 [Virgisporangium ochraceum]